MAQGLSRCQLLFSPYIQHSGLPAESLFFIQERLYKKILDNRQKILLERQSSIKTDNSKFQAGHLVFKRNEYFVDSTFPKSRPTAKELYVITYIPPRKDRSDKSYKVANSSFKVWIKNLRTNITSSTFMSNLRLEQVADLAYLHFDPYKQFGAQLRRIGNVIHNQDRGLSLLGGEEYLPEVMNDQVVASHEATQSSNEVAEPNFNDNDSSNNLGARPKRLITKPKKFLDFYSYTGEIETLFMSASKHQRKIIKAVLALHLEVCTQKCANHNIFKYLIAQGHTLSQFYGEIPSKVNSLKNKRKKNNRVQFDDTVQFSDGTKDILQKYKIAVEYGKQVLFLYSFYVDSSLKELMFVQLVN